MSILEKIFFSSKNYRKTKTFFLQKGTYKVIDFGPSRFNHIAPYFDVFFLLLAPTDGSNFVGPYP